MKHTRRGLVAALASLSLIAAACGGSDSSTATSGGSTDTTAKSDDSMADKTDDSMADKTDDSMAEGGEADAAKGDFKVANVVNGFLGDAGFFDDADRGMQALAAQGFVTETLQADPNNTAQWKANLESVSTGDYDIVIVGSSQMTDTLLEAVKKYPDQKYISYDNIVEGSTIASIVYKQNEGSFLAGVLAAIVTTDTETFPKSNPDKVVGLVGGMDIPVINDFVVGFEAGVQAVDPEIDIKVSYAGDFNDSQKGYDLATEMYNQGADVVFQVAGGTGLGVLQASEDADAYSIGVDQNQNDLHPGFVLASMLKNIGVSLDTAVNDAFAGNLKFGETSFYGLANDGVGLDFDNNSDIVPQEIIDQIEDYKQQVVDGKIEVPTVPT